MTGIFGIANRIPWHRRSACVRTGETPVPQVIRAPVLLVILIAALKSLWGIAILIACLLMLSGCIARTVEPRQGVLPAGELTMDWLDFGAVLGQACAGDRVDYGRLIQDPRPLDRFLARVARVGPRQTPGEFPTEQSRLAYAINCHNATILASVPRLLMNSYVSSWDLSALDSRYRFRIDGRLMTPGDLRREALGGDDWRVRFALCDGYRVGPMLSRRVFLPELLDGQLNDAVRAAFASPNVVAVSHVEKKQLLLWQGLYDVKDSLVKDYERRHSANGATILNVLLEWSDRPRREELNSAVGYDAEVLANDYQLNYVEPPTPENQRSAFSKLASFSLIKPAK